MKLTVELPDLDVDARAVLALGVVAALDRAEVATPAGLALCSVCRALVVGGTHAVIEAPDDDGQAVRALLARAQGLPHVTRLRPAISGAYAKHRQQKGGK